MASTGVHEVVADNVVANVGYRPDISIFQELQVSTPSRVCARACVRACVRAARARARVCTLHQSHRCALIRRRNAGVFDARERLGYREYDAVGSIRRCISATLLRVQ